MTVWCLYECSAIDKINLIMSIIFWLWIWLKCFNGCSAIDKINQAKFIFLRTLGVMLWHPSYRSAIDKINLIISIFFDDMAYILWHMNIDSVMALQANTQMPQKYIPLTLYP